MSEGLEPLKEAPGGNARDADSANVRLSEALVMGPPLWRPVKSDKDRRKKASTRSFNGLSSHSVESVEFSGSSFGAATILSSLVARLITGALLLSFNFPTDFPEVAAVGRQLDLLDVPLSEDVASFRRTSNLGICETFLINVLACELFEPPKQASTCLSIPFKGNILEQIGHSTDAPWIEVGASDAVTDLGIEES
jgi:hypothetical protein